MKTILVVDDEYALLELVTQLLADEGYHVVSAANGKDGLLRLKKERPDLLITDFMMPIADGMELIRELRALPAFEDLPVVLMSARTTEISETRVEILGKPFQFADLLNLVHELIGPGEGLKK